jgi:hypothetical protein
VRLRLQQVRLRSARLRYSGAYYNLTTTAPIVFNLHLHLSSEIIASSNNNIIKQMAHGSPNDVLLQKKAVVGLGRLVGCVIVIFPNSIAAKCNLRRQQP